MSTIANEQNLHVHAAHAPETTEPLASGNGPITPERLIQQLNWRYAAKQFDPNLKIPAKVWSALERALVLTPSSGGLQPWKFVVVNDLEVRRQLYPDAKSPGQVINASHLVAFAARVDFTEADIYRNIDRAVEVRGLPRESFQAQAERQIARLVNGPGAANAKYVNAQQLFIAVGNFLTSAALLGVDTCSLGGVSEKYDEILGLDKLGYKTYVAVVAGYRSAEDKNAKLPKVRYPDADVVLHR